MSARHTAAIASIDLVFIIDPFSDPDSLDLADERRLRVIFAKNFLNILIRNPLNGPAPRPCLGICPQIIDGYFILQRVQVCSGKALGQVKRLGVRQPGAGQPKLLVVSDGLHHERVLFPTPDGCSVVARDRLRGRAQRTAIGEDHAPVAIAATQQKQNASEFLLLDELESTGHLKLPRPAWRNASRQWIVLQKAALAMVEQRLRPRL